MAGLLGILVFVHVGFHAFLEDVFTLDGEYPPINCDAFVMQRLVKYADYVVACVSFVYVEWPSVAAVAYRNWVGLQSPMWLLTGFSLMVFFGCVVWFRMLRFVSDCEAAVAVVQLFTYDDGSVS